MLFPPASAQRPAANDAVRLSAEAITGLALKGTLERMAKRRHQSPEPFLEGGYWWIRPYVDVLVEGKLQRRQKRVKLAPDAMNYRDVLKIRDEKLRPINQSLESIGSATNFTDYVNHTYIPVVLPLMATSTQGRYRGIINKYLLPAFGKLCLRDLGSLTASNILQRDGGERPGT